MLVAIIVAVSVILDQLSKYLVVQNIEYHGTLPFIPKILSFYHTRNTGAAFSMLSEHRWVYMTLSLISMVIIGHLLYKEYKRHPLMTVSLAMVLGGGIGNMIDRFRLQYVVDFLKVEFMDFAIFNIADCFVSVGAVLLAVYIIFYEPKVDKRLREEAKLQKLQEEAFAVESVSEENSEIVTEEENIAPAEETVNNDGSEEENNG